VGSYVRVRRVEDVFVAGLRGVAAFLTAVFFAAAFFTVAFFTVAFFAAAFCTTAFFTDVARNAFFAAVRFVEARPPVDFVEDGRTSVRGLAVRRAFNSAAEFSGRQERPPIASKVSDEAGPALPEA